MSITISTTIAAPAAVARIKSFLSEVGALTLPATDAEAGVALKTWLDRALRAELRQRTERRLRDQSNADIAAQLDQLEAAIT